MLLPLAVLAACDVQQGTDPLLPPGEPLASHVESTYGFYEGIDLIGTLGSSETEKIKEHPFDPDQRFEVVLCELDPITLACVADVLTWGTEAIQVIQTENEKKYRIAYHPEGDDLDDTAAYRLTWYWGSLPVMDRVVEPQGGGQRLVEGSHEFDTGNALNIDWYVTDQFQSQVQNDLCDPDAIACVAGIIDVGDGGTVKLFSSTDGLLALASPAAIAAYTSGPTDPDIEGVIQVLIQSFGESAGDCLPEYQGTRLGECYDIKAELILDDPTDLATLETFPDPVRVICIADPVGTTNIISNSNGTYRVHPSAPDYDYSDTNSLQHICAGEDEEHALSGNPVVRFAQQTVRAVQSVLVPRALYAIDLGDGGSDPWGRTGTPSAWAGVGELGIDSGDGQEAPEHTVVPLDPTVLVEYWATTDAAAGWGVDFAVTSGGGCLVADPAATQCPAGEQTASVLTGPDGKAGLTDANTPLFWLLGDADDNPQQLTATSLGALTEGTLFDHDGTFIEDLQPGAVVFNATADECANVVVDGVRGTDEWGACAFSQTFTGLNTFGQITILWQRDATNAYFAAVIPQGSRDKPVGVRFFISDAANPPSATDDVWYGQVDQKDFTKLTAGDGVLTAKCASTSQSGCFENDGVLGGLMNTAFGYEWDGVDRAFYEFGHPLDSDDGFDMDMSDGTSDVRFYVELFTGSGTKAQLHLPAFQVYLNWDPPHSQ